MNLNERMVLRIRRKIKLYKLYCDKLSLLKGNIIDEHESDGLGVFYDEEIKRKNIAQEWDFLRTQIDYRSGAKHYVYVPFSQIKEESKTVWIERNNIKIRPL